MPGVRSPAVSPDGQSIAYGIWCDHRTLGFTKLATGANSRTDPLGSTTSDASPNVTIVQPLAWSPDSTHLLYRYAVTDDGEVAHFAVRSSGRQCRTARPGWSSCRSTGR